MDSKFYVSLEAARLLKEKEYNEEVEYMYDDNILTSIDVLTNSQIDRYYRNMYGVEFYGAPTKAEAIDWLDDKEVYIQIGGVGSGETQKWSYSVFDYKTCDNYASEYIFPTRLEAEEAAIIKALELL